ncbi:MAG: hypothetical protein OEZ34_00060 [Spirochaetia bacterium]|nr:hypothetical protein [Spirochaetia bacterium]
MKNKILILLSIFSGAIAAGFALSALLLFPLEKNLKNKQIKMQFQDVSVLYYRRQFKEAAQKSRSFLKKYPEHLEGTVLYAKIKFFTRDFSHAEAILKDYIKCFGESPYLLMWLGNILSVQRDRMDDALLYYRSILNHDPDNHSAHYRIGKIYEQKGMLRKALIEYQKASAFEAELLRIHESSAKLCKKLKLKEREALHLKKAELFQKAIQANFK